MTTPLEKWGRYLNGAYVDASLYSGIRELYDYAASEHERAERLASAARAWEADARDAEVWADEYLAGRDEARQVARQLLRVLKAELVHWGSESAWSEQIAIANKLKAYAALSPALRKLVEE